MAAALALASVVVLPASGPLQIWDPPRADSVEHSDARAEAAPAKLTWAPPRLQNPTTVRISAGNHDVRLKDDRDYVIRLPDEPLEVRGGVTISGGRNVVLIGGEIRMTHTGGGLDGRALYLKNQTGTVHVEGVLLSGRALTEGINLDQREGAVVQFQNIRVETVGGERDGHHADVLQTWSGPEVLRIDRLTGHTTYQGLFLLPEQFGNQGPPKAFDLRNLDIVGAEGSGYLLWRDDGLWPIRVHNVWVTPPDPKANRNQFLWARGLGSLDTWNAVRVGRPPGGSFVPAGSVGTGYTSPGYLDESTS